MSYPGYPPYQAGSNAPYPQQQYPPGAPYPPQPGVFAPSVGYSYGSPMYMPQPYTPGYPPQAGAPYPTGGAPAPYPTGGAPASYPQQTYNTGSNPHPNQGGSHHSSNQGHYGAGAQNQGPSNNLHLTKWSPTVVPVEPFNARQDAEILRKAMKGFGTDEKAIISVLARRTNAQRLQIEVEFKTMYGKDLISDLKSELSGNFENLIVAMMTPLPQFYAKELHDAISGIGTEENVLIEVLCTLSNAQIHCIRQAYEKTYYQNLEKDLKGDTGGHFKRLMVSLCNGSRDESTTTSPQAASADAQALLRAGELQVGTDESTFNMILCQRNHLQLRLVFDEYQRLTGHDIEKAIKKEFSGDIEDGLLAVVRSIKNQPAFFAKCLNQSVKGAGTNDRDLIRITVTRSEVDMGEIKREYSAKYGESLADAIKGDCSGDYKKCLLALIGES